MYLNFIRFVPYDSHSVRICTWEPPNRTSKNENQRFKRIYDQKVTSSTNAQKTKMAVQYIAALKVHSLIGDIAVSVLHDLYSLFLLRTMLWKSSEQWKQWEQSVRTMFENNVKNFKNVINVVVVEWRLLFF